MDLKSKKSSIVPFISMRFASSSIFTQIMLFISIAVFQINCEETTINPFEDTPEIFSIYGALDMADSVNYIRVKNIKTPLLQDSASIEPIEVNFTDLSDNTEIVINPEVINFNGNFTLNFPVTHAIQPNGRYQLTVTDAEGNQSTAIARTPGITIASVDTLGIDNSGSLETKVTECNTEHNFIYTNVKEGEQIFMFSGIRYQNRTLWARTRTVDAPTRIANTDSLIALLSVKQLLFDHFPLNDQRFVNVNPRFWPSTVNCNELDNNEILIRYFHFSEDWSSIEGDDISTNTIFESGVVENGIGFFGGMNSNQFKYRFKQ